MKPSSTLRCIAESSDSEEPIKNGGLASQTLIEVSAVRCPHFLIQGL